MSDYEGPTQSTPSERYSGGAQGINPDFNLMKGARELTPKEIIKQRADELRYEAAKLDELASALPDRMMGYAESALQNILKSAFGREK